MSAGRWRAVVTTVIPESALALLTAEADVTAWSGDHPPGRDELHELVAGADAVVTMLYDPVDAAFFDAAGAQLRCVANIAVGYDNIDVSEAHRRGVTVTNTPGVLTDATADLAIGLLLAVTRRMGEGERLVRAQRPWAFGLEFMVGTGLKDKTLGIFGMGAIGTAVARRARGFGLRIAYTNRRPIDERLRSELDARPLELEGLLAESDFLSLHSPLTPETHHLFDERRLRAMKPGAYLINTARGQIVDEQALVRVLGDGHLAGAGLDVFEHEPDVDPGLLVHPNVVLLPHLGSATRETRQAMAELAASNAVAVLAGRPPLTPVGG